MSAVLALLLFAVAWILLEEGFVFFAFIAIVGAVLSLIANSGKGANEPGVRVGGPVKQSDGSAQPPFVYQVGRAGQAFDNVGKGIFWVIRSIFGFAKKK